MLWVEEPNGKDYIDIYFILKKHYSITQVTKKALELFTDNYSEKLFRQQLSFFEDIDYSESIDWIAEKTDDIFIKKELVDFALEF